MSEDVSYRNTVATPELLTFSSLIRSTLPKDTEIETA